MYFQYLGETEICRGRSFLSDKEIITINILPPTIAFDVALMPNQVLPLTITRDVDKPRMRQIIARDKIFGVIHSE